MRTVAGRSFKAGWVVARHLYRYLSYQVAVKR